MIGRKLAHDARNMKTILWVTIIIIGVIGIFIEIPLMVLLLFYIIVALGPWIIVLLKEDLTSGLFIWIFLVLFSGAVGKINLPMFPDIDLYRAMWIFLILVFLVQIALKERELLPVTKAEIMMILFCAICLISMIKAETIFERGHGFVLRDFLNGYAIPFSIFFLAKNLIDDQQKIRKLFQFLFLIGIYLVFTGFFEHLHITSLVFPRYIMDPNVGIHWGRVRGPFLQAAVYGTVLGIILVISIYLVMNKQGKLSKVLYGIPILLMPTTIFFTYTRACWLGCILSISIIPIFHPRLRKIFFFGLFTLLIIVVLNWSNVMSQDRTIGGIGAVKPVYSRINLYGASFKMFLEKPIFGFGFNTFRDVSSEYFYKIRGIPFFDLGLAPHDTLFSILVELGIVGITILFLIFFYVFKHSVILFRQLPSDLFLGKSI
jgi:hypothetical protein